MSVDHSHQAPSANNQSTHFSTFYTTEYRPIFTALFATLFATYDAALIAPIGTTNHTAERAAIAASFESTIV